jgi:hypothetical protein
MKAIQLEKFIMKKAFIAAVTAIALALSVPTYAEQQAESETPVTDALYDVLLMRPFGAISVGFGTAVFIIGLPITLPLGEAGRTADEFIAEPFKYTFTRPIGDLRTGEMEEWEKERIQQHSERRRPQSREGIGRGIRWDE